MDVVDPDIGREPAQDRRQSVVRAAVQRAVLELPILAGFRIGAFELVLDVEQPDAGSAGDQRDRELDE